MKRVSFIAMIALALVASPRAIAQQAQGQQALCRDAEGKGYSQGAMTRGTDGGLLRCASGRWEPVPAGPSTTTAQSGQSSGQGSGQGRGATTVQGAPAPGMENVRLELVITDQTVGGQPIKKAVSLMMADRGNGRVRSQSSVPKPGTNMSFGVQLNADAQIVRVEGDRIRVHVTVEYAPAPADGQNASQPGSPLSQTVDVVLINGKAVTIVESSDPLSDRKVSLTATATIVR